MADCSKSFRSPNSQNSASIGYNPAPRRGDQRRSTYAAIEEPHAEPAPPPLAHDDDGEVPPPPDPYEEEDDDEEEHEDDEEKEDEEQLYENEQQRWTAQPRN